MNLRFFLTVGLLGLLCFKAHASNTSGVHGPVVNPDDRSAQYRLGFAPGEDGGQDAWAHRFHYQHAFNQDFRWRVITQFRDVADELEYDYLRAELLYHFRHREQGIWDSGVRFDIRTRKGSRPELFSINWTNQWQFTPEWRLRGVVIGGWAFGGNAVGGTRLETRASLTRKLDNGSRFGVEMFNEFGKVNDMGDFNSQEHQIGPVLSGKLGGISYQLGYLAGISNGADDHTYRLWFGKSF